VSDVAGVPATSAHQPSFVLHEHAKPRHHFDLRLEEDGVLRSWAVPRGLPDRPGGNRLAVSVPDHQLEHLTYTDADKSIADIGWWEEHDRNARRMVFTLHGQGIAIRYALIETDKDWLLHRIKDQGEPTAQPKMTAPPEVTESGSDHRR
jgi:DNA ligase D-like protein (predicted 3'-phosphoesterase)